MWNHRTLKIDQKCVPRLKISSHNDPKFSRWQVLADSVEPDQTFRLLLKKSLIRVYTICHFICINTYAHSCLRPLSNRPDAVFKHRKPCSNNGIHVLYEQVFCNTLKSSKWAEVCLYHVARQILRPGKIILSKLLLTSMLLEEMTFLMFDFASWRHFLQRDSAYEILLF